MPASPSDADTALARLGAKIARDGLSRRILLRVEGEGAVLLDPAGARRLETGEEAEADCTLSASARTFAGLMDGSVNPMSAVLLGRLKIRGDMGAAMELARLLG